MPLSIPVLDNLIQTEMLIYFPTAFSNPSPYNRFTMFTHAIATGVVTALTGATFTTTANTAMASVVGILGLNAGVLASDINTACISAWGGGGIRLLDECTAIATAIVSHLQSNALLSTLATGGGTGTASFITSSLSASIMSTAIQSATTFNGTHWIPYCTALSTAVVAHIKAFGTNTLSGFSYPDVGPGNGVVS